MTAITSKSAARRGNKTVYFHLRLYKKQLCAAEFWNSDGLAERRTCTQETFRCMHAFGRRPFWTHAVNLSVWTHEQADNFPGRHVLKLNVIAPYWVYWLSCKVVQLCIQVSQGSAATDLRWGGHYNITFFSSRSQNTTVKELLQEAQLSQRGRAMPRVVE